MVARRFTRGETLVHQGDPNTNVYLIESGHASVKVLSANGTSVTVSVLGPDDGFGELSAIAGGGVRTASVVALDGMHCHIIAGRDFDHLRSEHPEIDRHLVAVLAHQLIALDARLSQNLYETVQRRCARRLLDVAEKYRVPGAHSVTIPLTQDDLAGMTGATRPTTNQALGSLVDQGIIRLSRGRMTVHDLRALRDYVR